MNFVTGLLSRFGGASPLHLAPATLAPPVVIVVVVGVKVVVAVALPLSTYWSSGVEFVAPQGQVRVSALGGMEAGGGREFAFGDRPILGSSSSS